MDLGVQLSWPMANMSRTVERGGTAAWKHATKKVRLWVQSNPLNGSALVTDKYWTNKQIEPLTITFYYVSTKMGPAEAWTNNQIEPLSGDPLSGFDCTFFSEVPATNMGLCTVARVPFQHPMFIRRPMHNQKWQTMCLSLEISQWTYRVHGMCKSR